MDLKGFQYSGTIHPGPTTLIASLNKAGLLKVESITDEFVTLRKTHDVMAQLEGVVEGDMDKGYQVADDNVNNHPKGISDPEDGKKCVAEGAGGGKKRSRGEKKTADGPSGKRRKTVQKKRKK